MDALVAKQLPCQRLVQRSTTTRLFSIEKKATDAGGGEESGAGGRAEPKWWFSANWNWIPIPGMVYASFSPSSAIPIFDSRYRSALRDRPRSRAA
jgi:hypothetical protein